jgi:iron complex outermembrane recepter protein
MERAILTRNGPCFALLSTALTLAFTYSPTSSAQQAAQEGPLEEIVVTARYREERLQDTPIAITAITAQEIELRAFTASYELGYTIPNASLRPAQAAFGNTMSAFIRGIGQYDFLPEFEPGVGIYFDDVLHPVTMGSMVDLMDLERVEVLRGPQGTLFGRGSIGGAIRYVSRLPQGDNTGSFQVTRGDFDRLDLRGSYDFLITDNLFARISGVSKSRDGHQTVIDFACANPEQAGDLPVRVPNRQAGCEIGTQGGEEVTGARGALRWIAGDNLEVLITTDFLDDSSEARADTLVALAQNPAQPGTLPVPFNFWSDAIEAQFGVPFDERFLPPDIYTSYASYQDPITGLAFAPVSELKQWGVSGKVDWSINDNLLAELILSQREFDGRFATSTDQSPVNLQTVDGRQDFESFTAELRFSGRWADRLDWTLGYFRYDGEFINGQSVSIPAFTGGATGGPALLVNAFNVTEATNNSVFAHGVFDVNERLGFTAGARYSEDDKDEQFDNTIVTTTGSTSDTQFDWKLGVDYRFTDDSMAYVSVATGYRPQAFNPRPFQVTQFVAVDGEEATSYELGFKGDLINRSLRLNAALFYIDYSERILPVGGTECLVMPGTDQYNLAPPGTAIGDVGQHPTTGAPAVAVQDSLGNICFGTTSRTFYDNIPATVQGAELELLWRPTDALMISGVFGYTDFEGDELGTPSLLGPAVTDIFTDRPAYVPERNWNAAVSYTFGMGNGMTITPRVDVYGQTEICPTLRTNQTNPTVTDAQRCTAAFELVNARLEFVSPDGFWTAAFGVTNATDEEYFLNKFDLTAFGQPTIEGQPGRPREWYLTLRRDFF